TGNFTDCTFENRASYQGIVFSGTGCTPNFQCCKFQDLAADTGSYTNTLHCLIFTAPTFGYEGSQNGVSNSVSDTSDALLFFGFNGVKPIIDNVVQQGGPGGNNDWYQFKDGGKFIK